jgi:hypothetical protein
MPVHVCGSRCAWGRGCPRAEQALPEGCPALERGGPRSRGVVEPSSEADPARGGVRASSEADLARGSAYPSSEADFTRGASAVSSWRATGATRIVVVLCMRVRCASRFAFAFFAGFKRASPWLFRGPLGLSPTDMSNGSTCKKRIKKNLLEVGRYIRDGLELEAQ